MAGTGPCSGRGLEFGPEFCLPHLEVTWIKLPNPCYLPGAEFSPECAASLRNRSPPDTAACFSRGGFAGGLLDARSSKIFTLGPASCCACTSTQAPTYPQLGPQLRMQPWRINSSLIPKRTLEDPPPGTTISKIRLSRPSPGVRQHCTAPGGCLAAAGADSGDPRGLQSLLAGALLSIFVDVCSPTPFL